MAQRTLAQARLPVLEEEGEILSLHVTATPPDDAVLGRLALVDMPGGQGKCLQTIPAKKLSISDLHADYRMHPRTANTMFCSYLRLNLTIRRPNPGKLPRHRQVHGKYLTKEPRRNWGKSNP